jgi:serine/threonine protein kinase
VRSGFLTICTFDPQHSSPHCIIHRDLKPDNIGFDVRGDLKIFDFGMARELPDQDGIHDTTYNLTHMVGSLRYMAPEVALAQPYNAAADVYSFSLILWEILVLDRAYKNFCSEDQMRTKVFRKGTRPRLPSGSFSKTCNAIMEGGWSPRLQDRPSMYTINGMLRRELLTLRHGDDTGMDHQRRRSTFVFEHQKSTSQRSLRSTSMSSFCASSDIDRIVAFDALLTL